MGKINVLNKETAELIAAGEVIERPASVIKELVENSVDAGASTVTVEIRNGGIRFVRVSDNGSGIAFDDVRRAFLRHATSKLFSPDDLNNIHTLGFRGEALASISAVARVEMTTKQAADDFGTLYQIEGGEEITIEQCGCANGTTIIIKDLFFNTPARLKFLKKDISEANTVETLMTRLALANPQVSFRFIRDNKQAFVTPGDGDYYSAIYAIYGKQLAASLIPVENIYNKIGVTGYSSSPLFSRGNRSLQIFFVNGRFIRSQICSVALEQAYKNSIMVGKFPVCILNISIEPSEVDVNVHPAKTEVRFSDEKRIFDAVYFAVKNALLNYDQGKEIPVSMPAKPIAEPFETIPEPQIVTPKIPEYGQGFIKNPIYSNNEAKKFVLNSNISPFQSQNFKEEETVQTSFDEGKTSSDAPAETALSSAFQHLTASAFVKHDDPPKTETITPKEEPLRVIGELFKTYIVGEAGENLILMDKHAAHERINFERLKGETVQSSQMLAEPVLIRLSAAEYNALKDGESVLSDLGITLEFKDGLEILLKGVPTMLDKCDGEEIVTAITEIMVNGAKKAHAHGELFDEILHSMACKASIRAGDTTSFSELNALAQAAYYDDKIRFCPHGRPIITVISKKQLEKYFGRIQ